MPLLQILNHLLTAALTPSGANAIVRSFASRKDLQITPYLPLPPKSCVISAQRGGHLRVFLTLYSTILDPIQLRTGPERFSPSSPIRARTAGGWRTGSGLDTSTS